MVDEQNIFNDVVYEGVDENCLIVEWCVKFSEWCESGDVFFNYFCCDSLVVDL